MLLPPLPILEALPRLRQALGAHTSAVLQAPPGAGKSTVVPLALLEEPWIAGRRILMLEPRRVAARSVARRMATLCGEEPGATVGYRTRLEVRLSRRTRIEVVTEGVLTRMLQDDPALEAFALVIFDEFHERSVETDLGLALCVDARSHLRADLRLLLMSATLDTAPLAALLGEAPIVTSEGRSFPVETHFRDRPISGPLAGQDLLRSLTATIANALETTRGDLLVFLPGLPEIRRTTRLVAASDRAADCNILTLHGSLPPAEQDAVLISTSGQRRIVLSTNLAETSLTIEGITTVIDSGLERRSVFDPVSGMSRLVTTRISRAAAEQRCGRAGRLGPGHCYRLWTPAQHDLLSAERPPEILAADLAALALELAAWGVQDASTLAWLDAPPAATLQQARDLLAALGAVGATGRITPQGRDMARLGSHPRLAHLLLTAAAKGHARLGAEMAALLSERDLLLPREHAVADVDLRSRLDVLRADGLSSQSAAGTPDGTLRRRVLRTAAMFERRLRPTMRPAESAADMPGQLLATAYPDRIAQSRGSAGRFLLSGGRGAYLPEAQLLGRSEYLVVAALDAGAREARIQLAAPIAKASIEALFVESIASVERIEWDERERGVVGYHERRLGALVLERRRLAAPDPAAIQHALFDGLRKLGLEALEWTREARALQARIEFVRRAYPGSGTQFPACDDASLLADLDSWLAPWTVGLRRIADLARVDLHGALLGRLDYRQRQRLETLAPSHLTVPSGSRLPIDYSGPAPVLAVRLQELFGMTETPLLADGRVPLTLELLSPARRPVQLTRDLASFWHNTYAEVRRELAGRYPRHHWPEDPMTATPTARAKPRRS